jgi:hypothetical protein
MERETAIRRKELAMTIVTLQHVDPNALRSQATL